MKINVDDLIEKGLVKKKTYTEGIYKGLSVLKYTRKVFYDNLWHLDDRLLECRGTVVDEDDNVVVMVFKKVFNYGENNTGDEIEDDHEVVIPEKINGFMAAATRTEKYGLIVSTTGTLDSDYADLARQWIEKLDTSKFLKGFTYLFEICDKSDPHIVEEEEGAYLIGIRNIHGGLLCREEFCDIESEELGTKRPELLKVTFGETKQLLKDCVHEGFMVRCSITGEVLCKMKSPYYLVSKLLARCGKNKTKRLFDTQFKRNFDEEYYPLHDHIIKTYSQEGWLEYTEQERLSIIRDFINNMV